MTTKIGMGRRRPKADPLNAPVADEATAEESHLIPNAPPRPSANAVFEFEDALKQKMAGDKPFLERIDALEAAAGRAKADNEDTSGRCSDLVRQIAAAAKVVEDTRKAVKEPYFEAGKAVDDAARPYANRLNTALLKVKKLVEDFAREQLAKQRAAEAARLKEQQEREAREAEARKAAEEKGEPIPEPIYDPVPPPRPAEDKVQIRGDYGSVASTTKVWKGEIQDWQKAFKAVADNEKVKEAVQTAINARVRNGDRKIAGVRIFEDVGVRIR